MWEEQLSFCPSTFCVCAAATALEKEREDKKIHKFLFGLDESRFSTICSQIIDEDPLPDLNIVYSRVIRAEQHLNNMRLVDTKLEAVGFTAKADPSSVSIAASSTPRSRDPNRSCTRTGHDNSECFLLHGYPDWFLEQQQQQRSNSRGPSGNNNRGRGGRINNSGGRGRGRVTTASASTATTAIPADQISALIALLQNQQNQLSTDRLSGKTQLSDVIIDTGASHHMTGDLSLLRDAIDIVPSAVTFPDGTASRATKIGSLPLSKDYILRNVLFVPNFNCTLISVSRLLKQTGCIAIFTDTLCVLQDCFTKTLIGAGEEREGVYYFKGVRVASVNQSSQRKPSPASLWHQRLGHPSTKVLSTLPVFENLSVDFGSISPCDICFRAKQTRSVFPDNFNKALQPFALIHCDVWGPYRTLSSCGAPYFLTVVDDYSRAVWVYLMLEKSEVKGLLQNFFAMATNQFGKSVKTVRSDNGTEFMTMTSYFRQHGIDHQTSYVDTSQQNGRVERKHRHILNIARALLFQAKLPSTFWGESVLTAAHLINRTPTTLLQGKTPYFMLYGKEPSYDSLRTFGCLSYAHTRPRDKDKLGDRSRKCLFVGYPYGKKAWKLYDLEKNVFFSSRDVVFLEDQFPGITDADYVSPPIFSPDLAIDDWLLPLPSSNPTSPTPAPNSSHTPATHVTTSPTDPLPSTALAPTALPPTSTFAPAISVQDQPLPIPSETTPPSSPAPAIGSPESPGLASLLGRGQRTRKPSVLLKDYVVNTTHLLTPPSLASSSSLGSSTTVPGTTLYPISAYLSHAKFSSAHAAFLDAITSDVEPANYKEASQLDVWNDSMTDEYTALEENHTLDVSDLPPNKKAIACKWIYKNKYHANGKIRRRKSRLVACGNRQREGLDYTDNFAPVAKPTTVRLLLKLAAVKKWELHQMDVQNAFLHGDLKEEVYMKFPPGFEHPDPTKICRLCKSIYGLKQSPRCWFEKLRTALKAYGFKQSKADYTHFTFIQGATVLHILVYVDDFIIVGNDLSTIQRFKNYLCKCFHMKDLG